MPRNTGPNGKTAATVVAAVLAVIAIGGLGYLNLRQAQADDGATASEVLVIRGDHCHLVPVSCSNALTSTSVWFADTASFDVEQPVVTRLIETAGAAAPLEAFVFITTPPPRAA